MPLHGSTDVVHHHRSAPARQVEGIEPPESPTGAGDDRDLAVETDHETSLVARLPPQLADGRLATRFSTLTVSVPTFLSRADER